MTPPGARAAGQTEAGPARVWVTRALVTGVVAMALAAGAGGPGRAAGAAAAAPALAGAASEQRVAIVVDKGDGSPVQTRCVRFGEESISGIEALQRAEPSLDPVFASYSGQGTAVCSLCGTGCPAHDCLTCKEDGSYWRYLRRTWDADGWTYSRAGAGSSRLRDGDVEGWRFGTSGSPPLIPFEDICSGPPPEPRSSPSPSTTSTTSTTYRAPSTSTTVVSATAGPQPTTTRPGAGGRAGAEANPPSTARRPAGEVAPVEGEERGSPALQADGDEPSAGRDPDTGGAGHQAAPPPSPHGRGAGSASPWGLAAAAAVLAGFAAWAWHLRRTRRATPPA